MTAATEAELRSHLLRPDGQEDLCIAVYKPSTGATRSTALLSSVLLPNLGETEVHGIVSFSGSYVLRAIEAANAAGGGIAILHSHPRGSGWQRMSRHDADAEGSFAHLAREITGLPLIGLTLSGSDGAWSARAWNVAGEPTPDWCESVRVISDRLTLTWNDDLVPPPIAGPTQARPISCWGPQQQSDIARLRVLVVGAGTLGLDVAIRLAATGVQTVGVLDFDSIKLINLDRMPGATVLDAALQRSKVHIAGRLMREAATASRFNVIPIEASICEPAAFSQALDYDVVFSCIDDHPWPRSVINTLAYTDLIPVIDGGIHIDAFPDGDGMRNATWRSHVLRPGRPCMACNGQIDLGKVHADKASLLDDETYIAGLPPSDRPQSHNVAALAIGAASGLLAQFVSFVAGPAGLGDPGPLRFSLSTHWLEHLQATTRPNCPIEQMELAGDQRQVLLDEHPAAQAEIILRDQKGSRLHVRAGRLADSLLLRSRRALGQLISRSL